MAHGQFKYYASYAPDVTRLGPAKFQDHFGGSVVSSGDYRAVMFVVKCGGSEVDQSDFGIAYVPKILLLFRIVHNVMTGVKEQYVLWLEVGVGEAIVMKKFHCNNQLVGHLAHLVDGIWFIVVVLKKIKDAGA